MPPQYSNDSGITWVETKEKSGLLSSWSEPTYRFSDGEFIRNGEDIDAGFFKSTVVLEEVPILSSQDDGLNWEPVGSVPRGCIRIAAEASTDSLVLMQCTDGGIVSSSDRGRTWQPYLEPRLPDFNAFPANFRIRYSEQKMRTTQPAPPVINVN